MSYFNARSARALKQQVIVRQVLAVGGALGVTSGRLRALHIPQIPERRSLYMSIYLNFHCIRLVNRCKLMSLHV